MSCSVRTAVAADLASLAALFDAYRQFYGQAPDADPAKAFIRARLEQQDSALLLAVDASGEHLGFVQLYPSFSSVRMWRTYILNDLYVAPAARRRGVAKALLRAAAEWGHAQGACRLSLATAVDNAPAKALYESLGWILNRQFDTYDLPLA